MALSKIEGLLQRLIRHAAEGHTLLLVCLALSFGGTLSATYPATAVVVPAALLAPHRWRRIAAISAMGSALGATLLVIGFYNLGWEQIYEHFPQLATNATWHRI